MPTSGYPSMGQVEMADETQLARWYRFLPSPGSGAIEAGDRKAFDALLKVEAPVMDRICERLQKLGGMTPEISKEIGLGRPI